MNKTFALEELETGKVLSRKQIDRYGITLLQEIHRQWPFPMKSSAVPPGGKAGFVTPLTQKGQSTKNLADMRAKNLGWNLESFLNNALINSLAFENPRSIERWKRFRA